MVFEYAPAPESTKIVNLKSKYSSSDNVRFRLFGKNIDDTDLTITAQTRLNIPIQKLTQTNISVQPFNQNGMFYHFQTEQGPANKQNHECFFFVYLMLLVLTNLLLHEVDRESTQNHLNLT